MVQMGEWCLLAALDIIGSPGFLYEFRMLDSASISRYSSTEELSCPEIADTFSRQGVSEHWD